jgi:uncharacterized membrane-anchored protein YhcB (DUF1043 family)
MSRTNTIFTLPRGAPERYFVCQLIRGIPVTIELWIALFAALAIGATVGFVFAKRNAPKKSELNALRDQLHTAQTETAEIREGVSDHFEQSAVLFGRLAQDYRSFVEHFSESAQTLGISEGHARELLEQATQPLVSHDAADANAIEGAAVASITDTEQANDAEFTAAADSVEYEPESTLAAADSAEVDSTATDSVEADSATADSRALPPSDEVGAQGEVDSEIDERSELSADVAPTSAGVSADSAEPVTEEIAKAESSVAEVDFEPPAHDEIAEQKAG